MAQQAKLTAKVTKTRHQNLSMNEDSLNEVLLIQKIVPNVETIVPITGPPCGHSPEFHTIQIHSIRE